MAVPRLESELAEPVALYLMERGYEAYLEVPFNGRIADVVGVKGEEVVAVELKLRDYKSAHRQALAYQVGCHRTFVGLPLEVALLCLRKHRSAFHASGVGLLGVHTLPSGEPVDVRELLPARHHEARFLPFLADGLRSLTAFVRDATDVPPA